MTYRARKRMAAMLIENAGFSTAWMIATLVVVLLLFFVLAFEDRGLL